MYVSNPDQADADSDGIGDICDDDLDGDGIRNNLVGDSIINWFVFV